MSYTCDGHPDRTAAILVTNLGNGDVASLCGEECLGLWAAALAQSFGYTVTETAEDSAPTEDDTDDETTDADTAPVVTDPELPPVTVPEAAPDFAPDEDPTEDAGTSSPDVTETEVPPGTGRLTLAATG